MRGNDVYVVVHCKEYLMKREADLWTNRIEDAHIFYSYDEADKALCATSFVESSFVMRLR